MNLYLLTTNGLGDYHVIANNPTEAQEFLKQTLDKQNYGFSYQRRVTNIQWIAEEPSTALSDKSQPFLSDKSKKLLIIANWKVK